MGYYSETCKSHTYSGGLSADKKSFALPAVEELLLYIADYFDSVDEDIIADFESDILYGSAPLFVKQ